MKIRVFAILSLIAGSFAFASCIDDDATNDVIRANDKAAIKAYIDTTSIVNVKQLHDEVTGLRMIWQKIAPKDTIETFYLGDTVTVNYTGKFLSDKVFETTIDSVARANDIFNDKKDYEPVEFILGGVILGFQYGISNMEIGEKATVFVPSEFAYGRQGQGSIGPNTPLIFELELIQVKPIAREP
ncbi:FKBP-type peptidyl-prolyl cis-trans isomerase [Algoriphagus sp. NG3]|uniref:FKBP-type peptidyl-prolyl cis-trans isomerase n=1 Tax=unclassified Algoriphagus TaxID=2641541 RepID=UPI002A7F1EA9|nr:FKBP-type peptidyl-prolyl cis-trans isomerase [Algoriphagus sp. NG3]WPR74509.1 FKBP-type peptidyl-prolyl cis-trans isomerase [Algoriphagus sp. NG3]